MGTYTYSELRNMAKELGIKSVGVKAAALEELVLDEIEAQHGKGEATKEMVAFYDRSALDDSSGTVEEPSTEKKKAQKEKVAKAKAKAKETKAAKKAARKKKTAGAPSNKFLLYTSWKKSKEKKTAQQLLEEFPAIKLSTVRNWLGGWSKGKNLPAGVE